MENKTLDIINILNNHYEDNYNGTFTGCQELFTQNFELMINEMINDSINKGELIKGNGVIDFNNKNNNLNNKIDLLVGNLVEIFIINSNKSVLFRIKKQISDNTYQFLKELKDKRNDYAHVSKSIYPILVEIRSFNVKISNNFYLKYQNEDGLLAFFKSDINSIPINDDDEITMNFEKISKNLKIFDLIPGDVYHNDFIIEFDSISGYYARGNANLNNNTKFVVQTHYGNITRTYQLKHQLGTYIKAIMDVPEIHIHTIRYYKFTTYFLITNILKQHDSGKRTYDFIN